MIHIVGLGGVGFWLAVGLTRTVPADQLKCWDADTLSGGLGATRLPYGPPSTKKVDLLRGYLGMVLGDRAYPSLVDKRYSGLQGIVKDDLVVDCTDMPIRTRKRVWTTSKNKGAKLLRVSYDGRGSTLVVSTGLPLFAPPAGGYAAVPSLALSLAAGGVGAEAVKRYLEHPTDSFTFSLSIEDAMKPTA